MKFHRMKINESEFCIEQKNKKVIFVFWYYFINAEQCNFDLFSLTSETFSTMKNRFNFLRLNKFFVFFFSFLNLNNININRIIMTNYQSKIKYERTEFFF